jgi:Ca-activated chloride channel family protein
VRDLRWLRALSPYAFVLVVGAVVALGIYLTLPEDRRHITFANPWTLLLVAGGALVAWVGFHLFRERAATFSFSRVGDLARTRRGAVAWLAPLPRALRVVAVALIAVALARPQVFAREEVELEGIDIMIVLDLSKSMSERDLKPDRLDAAKRTVRRFIARRNDRVGLVIFGKLAMLQCPLTLDTAMLDRIVAELQIGDVDGQGTAIGDAVGLAVASLARSDAKSKVIILLTDGDSNVTTEMTPDDALEAAKARGIRVFTMLMGRASDAPHLDELGRRRTYATNPALLKKMAAESNGRYFNAGDNEALERGFDEVRATLEKSVRKEVRRIPTELYPRLAMPALGLLLLEVLLSLTRLRKFP